jgi:hypothetical protein
MSSEDKEITLRLWRESLSELLGWTDAEIAAWGESMFQGVSEGTIYHSGVMRYVAAALIPRSLYAKLSLGQRISLEDRLNDVLTRDESPDWKAIKTEVEAILAGDN